MVASNSESKSAGEENSEAELRTDQTSPSPNNKHRQEAKTKTVASGWRWLAVLLTIVVLALLATALWYGFHIYQGLGNASELGERQSAQVTAITEEVAEEKMARTESVAALEKHITDLQLVVDAQTRQIAELAIHDRDQWLVAELEYLLRLANQRLLTERRPQGALDLLEAADSLLASLDAPGALSARGVLAQDITALRLVKLVDREGIYSRLGSLTPAVLSLAALPSEDLGELMVEAPSSPGADEASVRENNETTPTSPDVVTTGSWYYRLWLNAKTALASFSENHFHVRYRDMPIEPLISSEQEQWLRHDMAINVATAQQALMRDEQEIYQASLATIDGHLKHYFLGSPKALTLAAEVEALSEIDIQQELPDIRSSVEALKRLQVAPPQASDPGGARP